MLFESINMMPFWISFKLAFITTIILFIISVPLAWFLSQSSSKLKPYIESLSALPIVLPPSVIGFYLICTLSPHSILGEFIYQYFDIKLIFNFNGLVLASCFYSLPFMLQSIQSGFENLNKSILEASYIGGKSKLQTIFFVAIPNIKPAIVTGVIITFAHTVGEFGVVLMIGGSIPNETKVASVAIYEFVEMMDYDSAHTYSIIMLVFSFIVLLPVYIFKQKQKKIYK